MKGNKPAPIKQSRALELRLLGALIGVETHEHELAQKIFTIAIDDFFYTPGAKELFNHIKHFYDSRKRFDMTSLMEALKPGSYAYDMLMEAIQVGYLTTNCVEQDLDGLEHLKTVRPQLKELQSVIDYCDKENIPELCTKRIIEGITVISQYSLPRKANYCESYESILELILSGEGEVECSIKTDLQTWPEFPSNAMITIAGRSGTGKTYLALFLMEHLTRAIPHKKAIYFNLEMQKQKLVTRHAAMLSGWRSTQKETVLNAAPQLLSRDISLVTKPGITIDEIELLCRSESMRKPLSVIVVDYIGLVRSKTKHDRKDLEQGDIAQRLAGLAIELNCIVLTLLQVNREHKNRDPGEKCPLLTDAADSIGCERSSSWWLGIDQPQIDSDEPEYKDLFIVKNRKSREDAGLFTVFMKFANGIFEEVDQSKVRLPLSTKSLKAQSRYNWPMKEHYAND